MRAKASGRALLGRALLLTPSTADGGIVEVVRVYLSVAALLAIHARPHGRPFHRRKAENSFATAPLHHRLRASSPATKATDSARSRRGPEVPRR